MAKPYTFNPSTTMYVKDWVAPPFTGVRSAEAMQMTPWLSFDEEIHHSGNAGYIARFLLNPTLTPLVGFNENPVNFHRLNFAASGGIDWGIVEAFPIMEGFSRHCWLVHAVRLDRLLTPADPGDGLAISAPIGTILAYAPPTVPSGWDKCWGQAVSRAGFPELFSLISTNYGAGDGTTTFNLPNLSSRVILGENASAIAPYLIGNTGGSLTTTLIIANLPPHGHQVPYSLNVGSVGTVRLGDAGTGGQFTSGLSNGASLPFSNVPPYQVVPYIIKLYMVSGSF